MIIPKRELHVSNLSWQLTRRREPHVEFPIGVGFAFSLRLRIWLKTCHIVVMEEENTGLLGSQRRGMDVARRRMN